MHTNLFRSRTPNGSEIAKNLREKSLKDFYATSAFSFLAGGATAEVITTRMPLAPTVGITCVGLISASLATKSAREIAHELAKAFPALKSSIPKYVNLSHLTIATSGFIGTKVAIGLIHEQKLSFNSISAFLTSSLLSFACVAELDTKLQEQLEAEPEKELTNLNQIISGDSIFTLDQELPPYVQPNVPKPGLLKRAVSRVLSR